MSYDISLCDPVTGEVLHSEAPHDMHGGTYRVGGTTELSLSITYNYARYFYRNDVFGDDGIRAIYGLSGAESIPLIDKAIMALGDNVSADYWVGAEGNAKRPLYQLLDMAKMRPDGVWYGD